MKLIGALIGFLTIAMLGACSDESTEKLAKRDGYYIGYKKIDVEAEAVDDAFPMALVYPTKTPSESVEFGPFEMDLSVGAKIAPGKFPLVIISHGSGGNMLGHRSIAFALAQKGFVVGIPMHPRNNFQNNADEAKVSNWKNRPLHISAAIDTILSNRKVAQSIDADKVAVIGHSAGGYTALAVAGGVANTEPLIELCLSKPQINKAFCELGKENQIKAEKIENVRDQRIKAIVLLAPVGILFDSKDALLAVDVPALLLRAEKDSELVEPFQAEVIAKRYPNKELLTYCTVPNAGHYSFITPFPESIKSEVGLAAEDPQGFDRSAFHQILSSDIVQFLDNVLNANGDRGVQPASCGGA